MSFIQKTLCDLTHAALLKQHMGNLINSVGRESFALGDEQNSNGDDAYPTKKKAIQNATRTPLNTISIAPLTTW